MDIEGKNRITGRFAPSPSGRMHVGNLLSALLAWLSARAAGGRMVLRWRTSTRTAPRGRWRTNWRTTCAFWGSIGTRAARRGDRTGRITRAGGRGFMRKRSRNWKKRGCFPLLLHARPAPCRGSAAQFGRGNNLLPAGAGADRGTDRSAGPPARPGGRLRLPDEAVRFVDGHYGPVEQNLARECGDIILRRSDGVFAYQLAVVLDDIAMGVTQVVRGRDLLSSTPRQMYLYRLFGASPPQYIHVPLLLARDGRRLSKREHDLDLGALRARGFSGEEIVGRVAYLAGLLPHPRPARPRDLLPLFSWEKVPKENLVLPEDLFRDAQ